MMHKIKIKRYKVKAMPFKNLFLITMMKQRTHDYCSDDEQEIATLDLFELTDECTSPLSRRLSRPPAAICAKPASRPRKFRLRRKLAEKNIRLSRRENSGLNTKKSITRVFSILKLITRACFALPRRRCYVFFVFMDKMHLISLHHCRYSKMHPDLHVM